MKTLNARKIGRGRSAGFTIIELVVVILLLGILAATALPRFIDVTDEAYDAAVRGVYGGFATGVGLFRAQWVANGQAPSAAVAGFGDSTAFAGAGNTGAGFPIGADATFTGANDCDQIWTDLLQSGRPLLASAGNPAAATDAARETVVETAAAANASAEYIAVSNATGPASKTGCLYYYVGRFASGGTGAAARTIPFISYSAANGEVTLSEQLFDN